MGRSNCPTLDALIAEGTVDCYNDSECVRLLHHARYHLAFAVRRRRFAEMGARLLGLLRASGVRSEPVADRHDARQTRLLEVV